MHQHDGDADPRIEEWRAAGLLDSTPGTVEDRLALLGWLAEQGITTAEIVRANAHGRMFAMVGDRIVRGIGERIDAAACAAAAGVAEDTFVAIWKALGFPDPEPTAGLLTEAEARTFAVVAAAIEILGDARGRRLAATISQSVRAIAEAVNVAFIDAVGDVMLSRSGSELVTAQTDALYDSMVPDLHRWIAVLHALHHEATNRHLEMGYQLGGEETVHLAVGFADVSDYTALSGRLSRAELAELTSAFGDWAADTVREGGALLVKTLGDGIFFVGSVASVVSTAMALTRPGAAPVGLDCHAGVTYGEVLPADGDYFGPTVNLAARLCSAAGPGHVLLDEATATVWSEVGSAGFDGIRTVKGFAGPVAVWVPGR